MARPPLNDAAATRKIQVRATEAQRQEILQVAAENHVNVATVMRDAISSYVADYSERRIFRQRRRPASR